MGKSLNSGWSVKNITPKGRKIALAGQYYERITTEIESDIKVTALAMDNGDSEFTWVSCDLAGVSSDVCDDVRRIVKEKDPKIDTENIFLSAIHTHNAPYIKAEIFRKLGIGLSVDKDEIGIMDRNEYHDFLVRKISEAVIEANKNKIQDCIIQTGVAAIKTGCCRRGIIDSGEAVMYIDTRRPDFVRMEAPDGGPVNLMYLRDDNNELKGVIACIPCPSQVLEHQFYISSDYAGRVRTLLEEKYGENFFFLPLISSSGDLSPRNLVTRDYGFGNMYDIDGKNNMAKRIFDAITAQENDPVEEIKDFSDFGVKTKKIVLPGWVPTDEEYSWALSMKDSDQVKFDIKDYVQKGVEPYFHTPLALAKTVETMITRYENSEHYKDVETDIAAIRIGNSVLVSNPFELFQEYATRMVTSSKARSFWSIQLVQNTLGYFPTDDAVKAGGYGAFIQSSRVAPYKAGDIFVRESVSLADSLFE